MAMNKAYTPDLQQKVEQFLAETGISQAKAAPMMGVSQAVLSQYRRSKYDKGDVAEVEAKLEEFFRAREEQEANAEKALPYRPALEYVPTSISEEVCKLIRYCQLEKGMVILHGDAGIGKTKGAEKFVKENPASAIYLSARPSTGTLANTVKMLAQALRVPATRNTMETMQAVQEKLEGTNKVIIIDEAQHLRLNTLDELRTLSDPNAITGQPGTGIVLIGNTEVYNRMVGKQEARFAQMFSRIRMQRYYSTKKVTAEDIARLFPKLAEEGHKKELAFLYGIGQSKWGIRGAVTVYNNAVNNEDITHDGLYSVARQLGIGLLI